MAKKSLFITYLLWMFGGIFGLHHFYLGRDFQALVWWMFAGGYFGLGLVRDLWRIPEYVKDANEEGEYMEKLANEIRKHPQPSAGSIRYFGQVTVADAFGYLILGAIPLEFIPQMLHPIISAVLVPIAVAAGAYLVGNIGRHEGRFVNALFGAYLTLPVYLVVDTPICITSFVACGYFNKKVKWRRTPKPQKSFTSRVTFLAFWGTVYLLLWSSWLVFNCVIVREDQEPVKCRDAAKHFFTSPIWKEFLNVITEIFKHVTEGEWKESWKMVIDALDPIGEMHALRVLGLSSTSSQQEITSRYRELSRKWHPDKHRDPEQKQIAQETFISIQQAYETLSQIKSQRIAQNVKNPFDENVGKVTHLRDDL